MGGRLFNGDMMLADEQWAQVRNGGDISLTAVGGYASMKNQSILWFPNGKTVPFTVSQELGKTYELEPLFQVSTFALD